MSNLDDICPSVTAPLPPTKQGKGYVPYKGHGVKNVSINPGQEKPAMVYPDKGVIKSPCGIVSPESKTFKLAKSGPVGYWSQGKDGPVWREGIPLSEATEPVKAKRPSHKNKSAFRGKAWGKAASNVTIVRK